MEQSVEQALVTMTKFRNLLNKYKKLSMQYIFLSDIKTIQKCKEEIEKCSKEIVLLKKKFDNLEPKSEEAKKIKENLEFLNKKNAVLGEALELLTEIFDLEKVIIAATMKQVVEDRDEDIHKSFAKAQNMKELKMFINDACISMYRVPLLIALITRDPSEIEYDFQISSLPSELKNRIKGYIEQQKQNISNNLFLSDKVLIDLVENVTGRNIADQQRHNEIKYTGFNKRFDGQVLSEQNGYILLNNQKRNANLKATSGDYIKKFDEFNRESEDMLVRDFPGLIPNKEKFRSFKDLDAARRSYLISVVISNLELCYEMIKSLYFSDKVEVPIFINLTNGKQLQSKLEIEHIPHLLGIKPAYSRDKRRNLYPNYPQETLEDLGLREGDNALKVLDSIIEKKNIFIEKGGLSKDERYEMLPWETIILKANAFIRGDFFKSTALISPINSNSYLNYQGDDIERVSITPTRFSSSAINQKLINPNIPFDETAEILRKRNSSSDFVVKGMIYRNGLWIPKTNVSAMGERIRPRNSSNFLQTLEKYRYLISGIASGSGDDGGFIVSAESPVNRGIEARYSATEMLNALIAISDSFGSVKEIQQNLRGYLDQIEQAYMDEQARDDDMGLGPGGLKR